MNSHTFAKYYTKYGNNKGLWMTFSWHTRPHSGLCGRRRLTEGRHKTLKEAGQRGPLNKRMNKTEFIEHT